MKAIDLSTTSPPLNEILELAGEDIVILRTPEGRQYVLAAIDDFAEEIARARKNDALMEFLDKRSQELARNPLSQVRAQLLG